MADISKIQTPTATYDIKDATARANIKTYTAGTGLSLSGTEFSVKTGYTTSGNNRKVQADSSGNLYVTQKDDNTTYTLGTSGNNVTLTPAGSTAQSITVPYATGASGISQSTKIQTADALNGFMGTTLRYAQCSANLAGSNTDGLIVSVPWTSKYGQQLYFDDNNPIIAHRYVNNGSWSEWKPLSIFTEETPTTGQVVITDGTNGGVKSSGYTIAKSVPSDAVFTDTKNTAGSTDTSSKIFLIGATSQAANPQTYSDNEVFATSGVLTTKSVQIGGGSATLQYNATTQAIDFVFA